MFFKNEGGPGPGAKRRTLPLLPLRDITVFPHMVSLTMILLVVNVIAMRMMTKFEV